MWNFITRYIGPVLSAIGTASSVMGTLKAGQDEADASSLQSLQAIRESQLADQQAIQEQVRGEEEKRLRSRAAEKLEARQRAKYARAGVKVGEGSPLLVFAETSLHELEDLEAIQSVTDAKASAFKASGDTFRMASTSYYNRGKSQKTASRFKAGSSLISGVYDLVASNP